MVIYLIKLRPFKSEMQQVIVVSDEFTIIFGVILLYLLLKFEEKETTSLRITFAIIGVIVASLIKNLSVILFNLIVDVYSKIKNKVHTKVKYEEHK